MSIWLQIVYIHVKVDSNITQTQVHCLVTGKTVGLANIIFLSAFMQNGMVKVVATVYMSQILPSRCSEV